MGRWKNDGPIARLGSGAPDRVRVVCREIVRGGEVMGRVLVACEESQAVTIELRNPAPACGTDRAHRWLVGHVHGLFKDIDYGRVVNVGVDVWGFCPVSETQLMQYWRERCDATT